MQSSFSPVENYPSPPAQASSHRTTFKSFLDHAAEAQHKLTYKADVGKQNSCSCSRIFFKRGRPDSRAFIIAFPVLIKGFSPGAV
jgi:hypothetical protein